MFPKAPLPRLPQRLINLRDLLITSRKNLAHNSLQRLSIEVRIACIYILGFEDWDDVEEGLDL